MVRILALLASLASLAIGLTACGTEDFDPDVVAQAADKTAAAGGAKLSFDMKVEGERMRGDGFMDTKGSKGRMRFSLPQNAGEMRMVFLGQTMYMSLPKALREQSGFDETWMKFDLGKVAKQQGIDLGSLGAASNDPSAQLDQLRGAGKVEKVGTDTVRGAKTTRYKATIDLRKAAEQAPAPRRAAARRSTDRLIELSGQRTFPMDVWIDDQGRLRRERFTQQGVQMTMDLYGFGAREAIKAPPASETKDISKQITEELEKG